MATHPSDSRDGIAVHTADPSLRIEAERVAHELRVPVVDDPHDFDLVLRIDDSGWSLVDPASPARGVRCDLTAGELARRLRETLQRGPSRRDRLARALGFPGDTPTVFDATAGLGRESVLAAAFGCRVVACERSPIVALLLRDGLRRAATISKLGPIVERIDVRVADAREELSALEEGARPDVVMVDPMFPESRKSSLAKLEMQILQRLLGEQAAEAPSLLEAALHAARRRVVVKRPAHAPPVETARQPDFAIPGRASRYDIYLTRS